MEKFPTNNFFNVACPTEQKLKHYVFMVQRQAFHIPVVGLMQMIYVVILEDELIITYFVSNMHLFCFAGLYGADHLPTSSEHSLGAISLRHESWEFDSGARDLSPEPNTLYKLIEAAGISLSSNPSQILEIANKVSGVYYLPGTPIAVAGTVFTTEMSCKEMGEIGRGVPY